MIARLWRGVVPAGRGDAYAAYLDRTGVRDCRATPGNRGVLVLRRDEPDTTVEGRGTTTIFVEAAAIVLVDSR